MEIISYVLAGAVRHEDSMGNRFVIPAGGVQIMSAGTGVMHSDAQVHLTSQCLHRVYLTIAVVIREASLRVG